MGIKSNLILILSNLLSYYILLFLSLKFHPQNLYQLDHSNTFWHVLFHTDPSTLLDEGSSIDVQILGIWALFFPLDECQEEDLSWRTKSSKMVIASR